jgi:hypothetical protein
MSEPNYDSDDSVEFIMTIFAGPPVLAGHPVPAGPPHPAVPAGPPNPPVRGE